MKYNILTGVRSTGYLHLGNYIGALAPLINLVDANPGSTPFLFIADYHSLTCLRDQDRHKEYRQHIALALYSLDLKGAKIFFQSDIPELMELYWIFSSYVNLGSLYRCHAYKASAEKSKINLALLGYPVLMAADILGLDLDLVTVGEDQSQHTEVMKLIAKSVGLEAPKIHIQSSQNLIGTDGRKMSKSYDNTIPIFACPDQMKKVIMKMPTNSQGADETKDSQSCNIFALYSSLATLEQTQALQVEYTQGISWKRAKERLYELIMSHFSDMRERYIYYKSNSCIVNKSMSEDALLVRARVAPILAKIKQHLGLL